MATQADRGSISHSSSAPPYTPADAVEARSLTDQADGARISKLNGRWIHVAGVWDRSGIAGSKDKIRLYVNGKIVAASQDGGWGMTPCGRRVSARPGGACFTDIVGCNDECARTFAVDDLKVWGYAKTDYGEASLTIPSAASAFSAISRSPL